jgi:hypothetical protein
MKYGLDHDNLISGEFRDQGTMYNSNKKTPITPCGQPDPGWPIDWLGAGHPQGVSL